LAPTREKELVKCGVEVPSDTIKLAAKSDLYFFCKYVLGYKDLDNNNHRKLCSFLQKKTPGKDKHIEMPRGTFKTSIVTVGFSLFLIVNCPNIRILIIHEEKSKAAETLSEIKWHIEENEKFRALFGDLKKEPGWREDKITVATRTKGYKEPTITIAGTDSELTGGHYDIITCDDLVGATNSNSPEQLLRVIEYFQRLGPLAAPEGKAEYFGNTLYVVVGTRWDDGDLYGWLIENFKNEYEFFIRGALKEGSEDLDKGELEFPTILSREKLKRERKKLGAAFFSSQYLNKPISEESAEFKKDWIKTFSPDELPKDLVWYAGGDLAISQEDKACNRAFVAVGVDKQNNWWVEDCIAGRWNPAETIEALFYFAKRHPFRVFAIENDMTWKALKLTIEQQMRERGQFINFKELTHAGAKAKSKDERIRGLIPRFRNQTVFIRRDLVGIIDELRRFPKGKTKDRIDALANILEVAKPQGPVRDEPLPYRYGKSPTGYF